MNRHSYLHALCFLLSCHNIVVVSGQSDNLLRGGTSNSTHQCLDQSTLESATVIETCVSPCTGNIKIVQPNDECADASDIRLQLTTAIQQPKIALQQQQQQVQASPSLEEQTKLDVTMDGLAPRVISSNLNMNIDSPYLSISYIVALSGLFPNRSRRRLASGQEEDMTEEEWHRSLASGGTILGQIMMFGGNFAPRGWAFCEGQLIPISANTALFSLFGTIYGGDGRTTFALPDMRGRSAVHFGAGGINIGNKGGSRTANVPSREYVFGNQENVEVTINSVTPPSSN